MKEALKLLNALEQNQSGAPQKLLPLVYDELRLLAAYRLAHEQPGQTLQATALVNEAYLRLVQAGGQHWEDARHFFNAIAEAMRRILIDNARRKQSLKRGCRPNRLSLEDAELPATVPPEELLAVDEVLERLARAHPEEAQVVKLRYFVGLTQEETACVLGISRGTVNNRWRFARAWLYQALHPNVAGSAGAESLHKRSGNCA